MPRPRAAYAVVFHFDGNFGLNYKDTPDRRKRTVNRDEWWRQRHAVMRDFVLPSLANQTFKDFDVWALFMPGYEKKSKGIRKLLSGINANISFDGPAPLRAHYAQQDIDWLGLIHHDSDDLYSRDAFKLMSDVKPALGKVAFFRQGYIYGVDNNDLRCFGHKQNPPLSFHMMYYPAWALTCEPNWYGYRRTHQLAIDHFQIASVPGRCELAPGNFCQLIHGTNTVSAWKNPNVQKRLRRKISNENERIKVLARFGVKA